MIDIYRQNEQRHRDKAEYWLQQGLPEYAAGSLRKAAKWQTHRRAFEYAMNGAYPKKALDSLVDDYLSKKTKEFADEFARGLIWGIYAPTSE